MSKEKDIKVIDSIGISLTEKTEIRVSILEVDGERRLDIRTYINSDRYTGHTQKGVNIPIEKSGEIMSAINKLINKI